MGEKVVRFRPKKVLITVLLIILIPLIAFIAWFVWAVYTEKPPVFFPLNNPKGVYKVTKACPSAQGWEERTMTTGDLYCIEYKGTDVLFQEEGEDFFRITVGRSDVDLEKYLGMEVRDIEGKFVYRGEQCILEKCTPQNGPRVVLDIYKLNK
jgi:hypothetical protein